MSRSRGVYDRMRTGGEVHVGAVARPGSVGENDSEV